MRRQLHGPILLLVSAVLTACGSESGVAPLEEEKTFPPKLEILAENVVFTWIGQEDSIAVLATDLGGNPVEQPALHWVSRDSTVVTVHGGRVKAVKPGETTLVANWHNTMDSVSATVDPKPYSIALSSDHLVFAALGDTVTVHSTVEDQGGHAIKSAVVSWETEDTTVVEVIAPGVFVARGSGATKVSARFEDLVSTISASVTPEPAAIVLRTDPLQFTALGSVRTIHVDVVDKNSNAIPNLTPTFSSRHPGIASVNRQGLVTAIQTGTTTVDLRLGPLAAELLVTIKQVPVSLTVSPPHHLFEVYRDTMRFQAVVKDANDHPIPNQAIQWSVRSAHSYPRVWVDDGGLTEALRHGTDTIVATAGNLVGRATVAVSMPRILAPSTPPSDSVFSTVEDVQVQVVGRDGEPVEGLELEWSTGPAGSWWHPQEYYYIPIATVAERGTTNFATTARTTTNSAGVGRVRLKYGPRSRNTNIQVSPVDGSFPSEEIEIVIRSGLPDTLHLPSHGETYLHETWEGDVEPHDAYGNPATTATVTWTPLTPHTSVEDGGVIRGLQNGKGILRLTVAENSAIQREFPVVVVPHGEVIREQVGAIWDVLGEHIEDRQEGGRHPKWEPNGSRFIWVHGSWLWISERDGTSYELPLPTLHSGSTRPDWGRDGRIYFHGAVPNLAGGVWRVNPDGSELEEIAHLAWGGSPDPTGSRVVVYRHESVYVKEIATGEELKLGDATGQRGVLVRWSPDGEWIAYPENGEFMVVMRPDGTGKRSFPTQDDTTEFGWSPDSRWILTTQGTLVDVVEGWSIQLHRGRGTTWKARP